MKLNVKKAASLLIAGCLLIPTSSVFAAERSEDSLKEMLNDPEDSLEEMLNDPEVKELIDASASVEEPTQAEFEELVEESRKKFEESLNDPQFVADMKAAEDSKSDLKDMENAEQEVGIQEFWESLNPEDVQYFYIHDDGTVTLKDTAKEEDKAVLEEKAKEFEEKFRAFTERIDSYNQKNGFDVKPFVVKDGELAIGDSSGSGSYNTPINLNKLVVGDVMLASRPGMDIQGWMEHAGIYNGNPYYDHAIYSAAGPGKYATWERVSSWKREFNEVWAMGVWGTSKSAAEKAYRLGVTHSYNEPYYWYAAKFDVYRWYCSKIPWMGHLLATGKDIDYTMGYWVLPSDIYYSGWTYTRVKFKS